MLWCAHILSLGMAMDVGLPSRTSGLTPYISLLFCMCVRVVFFGVPSGFGSAQCIAACQGLNYDSRSVLADQDLRPHLPPITTSTMDWMHNLCVNGVVNVEIHAFLSKCKASLGIRFSDLHSFVSADWRWPHWQQTHKAG